MCDDFSAKAKQVTAQLIGDRNVDADFKLDIARGIEQYIDALRWCSGSKDFQVGGQARRGWIKLVVPLIN